MAIFSERHYEWLARFAGRELFEKSWEDLASYLAQDDPRFNRDRFLAACEKNVAHVSSGITEKTRHYL